MNHQEEIDKCLAERDVVPLAKLEKLELRDYLACFAMQSIIAKDSHFAAFVEDMDAGHEPQQGLAEHAYKIADAMVNESKNQKYSQTEYPKYNLDADKSF